MGSMADAVNAPENKPQAGETSIHGGSSLGETAPGQVSLPDPMSPANPKSPTETQGDKAEDAGDLGVSEPPEKKARKYMEEEMGHRMKRVREGFDLTSSALDKVQQHLDISRQNSKDLTQLAQEVHYDKVGAKYTLAQMQSMLSCFQNVEWQLSGSKADANTSLKAVANKTLAQATLATQNLKSIHTEIKDGNEKLLQAVADGFGTLAAAFTAMALPSKESVGPGCPPAPPAAPLAASNVGQPMTAMYGTPGYSSGYPMPSAPLTPAMPPGSNMTSAPATPAMPPGPSMPSGPPVGMGTPSGSMGSAPMAEQPTRPLVLTVKDEAGQARRAAVSPTRHAPGSQLPGAYLNEFGLGCVSDGGFFHRRLPDVFLPKGI